MPSNDDDDGVLFDLSEFTSAPPPKFGSKPDAPKTVGDVLATSDELEIPELGDEVGKELYLLASAVQKSEPWLRLREDDWFAIRDPGSDEIMVVSIMGMARQNVAVQLYLPEEGIRFWNQVLDTGEVDQYLLQFDLRMIECEFADRQDLEEFDLAAHDRFSPAKNLKRSGGAYTMFRSFRPGFHPWPIGSAEAEKMALALRLVPRFEKFIGEHYEDFYEESDDDPEVDRPLVPLFSLKAGGNPREVADWEISSCPFPNAKPAPLPEAPRDDLFAARLAAYAIEGKGEPWECGCVFIPQTVLHEGRIACVMANMTYTAGAMIAAPILGLPDDCRVALIRRSFSESAEAAGFLPGTVLYKDPVVELALREFAEQRGIRLQEIDALPNLEELVDTICGGPENLEPELLKQLEALDPEILRQITPKLLRELENAPHDVLEKLAPILAAIPFDDEPVDDDDPIYRQPTSASRYVMRIDLIGAKPPIWRRISMPIDSSLFDLHCAIQDAMGWEDDHLHEFALANGKAKGRPKLKPCDWQEEISTTLEHLVKQKRGDALEIFYLYDFGDNWGHKIVIEKELEPKPGASKKEDLQPKLIAGNGVCPFEDCGGIWGWQSLLKGEHHFLEDWDDEEIESFNAKKFEPSAVRFYPASGRASGFIQRNQSPF